MDNYEAIMKMDRAQLEIFLDNVYCAGLNNGMYATRLTDDEADKILEVNPFDMKWLTDDAEPATLCVKSDDDEYLLNALVKAVFRNAEIAPDRLEDSLDENKNNKQDQIKEKL